MTSRSGTTRFRRPARVLGITFLSVVLTTLSAACSTSGIQFESNNQVSILSPAVDAVVTLPTTIRWRASGLVLTPPPSNFLRPPASTGRGVYFGVFVDHTPMSPGATVLTLADATCKVDHYNCVSLGYFEQSSTYFTDTTSIQIPAVPTTSNHHPELAVHTVYIVLMSGNRRMGETVYTSQFFVRSS